MAQGNMQFGALNDAGASVTTLRTLNTPAGQTLVTLWIKNDQDVPPGVGIGLRVDANGGDFSYGVYSTGTALGVGGFTPNVLPTVGPVPGPGVLGTGPIDGVRGVNRSSGPFVVPVGSAGVIGRGEGLGSHGIIGEVSNTANGAAGVLGIGGPNGAAGRFDGRVQISGLLNVGGQIIKGGGGFKIDHPLDPENKYLFHSFVESPDALNIYRGNVSTDDDGNAVVVLPTYFEALNRDFCYQLTVLGEPAHAVVAEEIGHNQFTIKTDRPKVKVSWQVTGIRKDAFANLHRAKVEEEKSADELGTYLHPEAFGHPETRRARYSQEAPEALREALRIREAQILDSLPREDALREALRIREAQILDSLPRERPE